MLRIQMENGDIYDIEKDEHETFGLAYPANTGEEQIRALRDRAFAQRKREYDYIGYQIINRGPTILELNWFAKNPVRIGTAKKTNDSDAHILAEMMKECMEEAIPDVDYSILLQEAVQVVDWEEVAEKAIKKLSEQVKEGPVCEGTDIYDILEGLDTMIPKGIMEELVESSSKEEEEEIFEELEDYLDTIMPEGIYFGEKDGYYGFWKKEDCE